MAAAGCSGELQMRASSPGRCAPCGCDRGDVWQDNADACCGSAVSFWRMERAAARISASGSAASITVMWVVGAQSSGAYVCAAARRDSQRASCEG